MAVIGIDQSVIRTQDGKIFFVEGIKCVGNFFLLDARNAKEVTPEELRRMTADLQPWNKEAIEEMLRD